MTDDAKLDWVELEAKAEVDWVLDEAEKRDPPPPGWAHIWSEEAGWRTMPIRNVPQRFIDGMIRRLDDEPA